MNKLQRTGLYIILTVILAVVIAAPTIFVDGKVQPGNEAFGFIVAFFWALGGVFLVVDL